MQAVARCLQTLDRVEHQSPDGIITIETRLVKCSTSVVVDLTQITLIPKSCATKHVRVVKTSSQQTSLIQVCKN